LSHFCIRWHNYIGVAAVNSLIQLYTIKMMMKTWRREEYCYVLCCVRRQIPLIKYKHAIVILLCAFFLFLSAEKKQEKERGRKKRREITRIKVRRRVSMLYMYIINKYSTQKRAQHSPMYFSLSCLLYYSL
jgi:hypothetical protein